MNVKKKFFLLISFLFLFLFSAGMTLAQTCSNTKECEDLINQYTQKLNSLKVQSNTLSNQIAQFNAQISLTTLKIKQTEEQIELLGGRIDQLEGSLSALSSAFASRAIETYKMSRAGESIFLVLSSNNIGDAVSRYHYLQRIQEADRNLLIRLQTAQNTYKDEKGKQEELAKLLDDQKQALTAQKAAKANLLAVTKNDERKYQSLLAAALAEYEAIQGIIAGRGFETEVGKVNQGQRIASVIQGQSCNSSGSHLHFIVSQNGAAQNPFNYLRNGVAFENCSGSSCGSSDGDSFSPTGSWDWPISPLIKFSQGYGSTWATRNTYVGKIYSFHNGIDINSQASSEVRAVKVGTLYQGSYGGRCLLRYVRVHHDEGGLDTFYLHINY